MAFFAGRAEFSRGPDKKREPDVEARAFKQKLETNPGALFATSFFEPMGNPKVTSVALRSEGDAPSPKLLRRMSRSSSGALSDGSDGPPGERTVQIVYVNGPPGGSPQKGGENVIYVQGAPQGGAASPQIVYQMPPPGVGNGQMMYPGYMPGAPGQPPMVMPPPQYPQMPYPVAAPPAAASAAAPAPPPPPPAAPNGGHLTRSPHIVSQVASWRKPFSIEPIIAESGYSRNRRSHHCDSAFLLVLQAVRSTSQSFQTSVNFPGMLSLSSLW